MDGIIYCIVVILIILLIVLTSGRSSSEHLEPSIPIRGFDDPIIPLNPGERYSKEYCPYRSLIGIWRTTESNSIPAFTKEYEFTTLPDGKTIMLIVRHIMSNPEGYGKPSMFTRGACILSQFKCQNGFAGDVKIEATCVSPTLDTAPLNDLPRSFNVIVNSKETILIDTDSSDEFHKL